MTARALYIATRRETNSAPATGKYPWHYITPVGTAQTLRRNPVRRYS